MSSRICIPQDSTDSNLDVPVLEALQRRHSDVKLNTTTANSVSGVGLAPPRSPELRRHSDVSPASLRELEKLKKEQRTSSSLNTNDTNDDNWGGIPGLVQIEPPTRVGSRRQSRVSRQHRFEKQLTHCLCIENVFQLFSSIFSSPTIQLWWWHSKECNCQHDKKWYRFRTWRTCATNAKKVNVNTLERRKFS